MNLRLYGVLPLRLSPLFKALPLFWLSSSGGQSLEVIRQEHQKGKERLSGVLVLCLSGLPKPPPLFSIELSLII